MTKEEIIEIAQPLCPDSSFTVPSDTRKFYTAWKSMETLEKHFLVYKRSRPLRYFLSDDGRETTTKMQETTAGKGQNSNDRPAMSSRAKSARPKAAPKEFRPSIVPQTVLPTLPDVLPSADPGSTLCDVATSRSVSQVGRIEGRKFNPPRTVQVINLEDDDEEVNTHPTHQISNMPPGMVSLLSEAHSAQPVHLPGSPSFTPQVLQPGMFTIHLVLDNREVRARNDRDHIAQELSKLGTDTISRALELGDCVWIVRSMDPLPISSTSTASEFMLPHILERKRLDDLWASIKDGRYNEQKTRLKRSGIPPENVTYLVEEYTQSEKETEQYVEAIASAIAQTQVVSGFFVKRTLALSDSIRYLHRLTKTLTDLYASKPLHIIPTAALLDPTPKSYSSLSTALRTHHPQKTFLLPFSTFSSLCSKSDLLTLRDIYLKMLMCTRGISAEKALEIQKRWPTPRSLVEAYERRGSEISRAHMISEVLGAGLGRKKITPSLSRKIAEIWGNVAVVGA